MTRVNCIMIACISVTIVATGCSEHMGKGWDWNRMRVQPRYEPYRSSGFFPDGMTMQSPPTGTVAREAGEANAAPLAITGAVIARGASQYHIYCAVCHGERGDGVSIVASNMDQPKPPPLIEPPVSLMPASVVVRVVTHGLGSMPSFAAELSPADRHAVAAYVKTLQSGKAADADTAAAQP